ncbi:MAG: GTP cyclohydrolase I FolE2 [Candidatus Korarchaeota archaeon]|nr:GTP cyclohydrolase I FolE2 [Candidatus Korarchaeota archaeon]
MNFRRSIIIEKNSKRLNLIAKINAFVDLLAGLKGVRMSRDVKTIEKNVFLVRPKNFKRIRFLHCRASKLCNTSYFRYLSCASAKFNSR